ncbi:MAG: GH3 auxin-responsive promoter family protein [Bacteroidales bacterium]|nr:GH3 auxin-responsive promoter family protein [Bacteroidales bacterium]
MAVIGEIIKVAIEAADKFLNNPDPVEAQKEVLKDLLSEAKHTAFGKHYNFRNILAQKDLRAAFANKIPYHNYDRMFDEWWHKVLNGQRDITWPGKVDYFAVSSGTTSKKKHIPVTDDMMKSIRKAGIKQLKGMANFDMPGEFYEKEILMFGSSTDLKKVNGHYEGEISGISASQLPFWFEGYYRPGKEIAAINDWDRRVEAVAREAPNWDIGSISGIPSWVELMIKKVMAYHKVDNIHEIWPNFKVFTSGGVAFEPYKKSFDNITGKPIIVIDTYLTSEGYLATQTRKDTDAMRLITDNGIYFEFVPFNPDDIEEDGSIPPQAKALTLEEVEEGVEYVLIISTVSGAWRYMIGDTIVFTDKERAEIKITGRTKHYLNVVGSQLSVIQMNHALKEMERFYDCDISEFTVAALKEHDEYLHRWYLGVNGEIRSGEQEVARRLDGILQENNKNYAVARTKALKSVEVKVVPVNLFYQWTEETKQKGGQAKVPRVMKAADFRKWEEFVNSKLRGEDYRDVKGSEKERLRDEETEGLSD